MKKAVLVLAGAALVAALCPQVSAGVTSAQILSRVKAAEAGLRDFRADMTITDADKGNISEMGKRYDDVLMLKQATVYYARPDKMRFDGIAKNIKVTLIQNGYKKLVLAAMLRKLDDVKNAPGKRQDTLDLGFLSSRLWTDNHVTVVSNSKDGTVQLKVDPKLGGPDKRHDLVWIQPTTLKVLKRVKHSGDGTVRARYTYSHFQTLAGKLPIATQSKMFNPAGEDLGTVNYRNLKANTGLKDGLFSLSSR